MIGLYSARWGLSRCFLPHRGANALKCRLLCVYLCVCECTKAVYTTSDCVHIIFWQDLMRTHRCPKLQCSMWKSWSGQLERKGSLKSFDASDTPCSLWWEHWPFCIFSCCDHPLIYSLKHSLYYFFMSFSIVLFSILFLHAVYFLS